MEFEENEEEIGEGVLGAMSGVVLQVTTRFDHNYEYDVKVSLVSNSSGKPEYVLVGGYAVDVFFYLQSLLQFSYVLRPDTYPPKYDKASVEKASLDLYLASYSLLPERAQFLEPTFVVGQSRILAFMDHAFEGDSANQNIFIIPFTTSLWVYVLILMSVFIVSLLIFNYFEDDPEMGMGDIIFFCISMYLQKGSDNPNFRNSTRIASTFLSFAVLIIMASYSGIMTSIFAVNRYTITSIEALVQSNYRILMEYGYGTNDSTIKFMLQQLVSITSVAKLLKRAEKSKFVYSSFQDSIREVKRAPSTYIIDEETGLDTISQEWGGFPCTWSKLSVFNLRYPWVMYMRKAASFQRPFNSGIVRIRERGILNRIRKKWIRQPGSACTSSDGAFRSIDISQVESAFNAYFVGILIFCPTLFLVEKLIALCRSCIKNRKVTSPEKVVANEKKEWYM